VTVGDFDNDAYADLYVTAYGGNTLCRNNGNGTFSDVTTQAGVGGSGWSTSAAWMDLDNDGRLDLVVLRYNMRCLKKIKTECSITPPLVRASAR
jgi:hypothetical protein